MSPHPRDHHEHLSSNASMVVIATVWLAFYAAILLHPSASDQQTARAPAAGTAQVTALHGE